MKPFSARPSEAQRQLVAKLGGPTAVARIVSEHLNIEPPMTSQAVSMWARRGIPFAYRAILAIHAREQGISVPPGFLNENPAPRGSVDDRSHAHIGRGHV